MANAGGRGWAALLTLAVVPFYIHLLGIEAYGLIGVYLSLTAIFALLDFGLGTALNRQLAHYSLEAGKAQEARDLLRTLEVVYWLVGVGIGTAVAACAPFVATQWIKPQQLSEDTVAHALLLMALALACQWPRALYSSGLSGIQKQVALNVLSSIMATVLNVGGVLVVWGISTTIQALLGWYTAVMLADTLLTRALLWRSLPQSASRPVFDKQLLMKQWRFAAGMTGISVTSVILTQLDKIILSKVLSLDAFGYYSLAWRVAGSLYYVVTPITTASFPRFTQLALLKDQRELARLYHRSCQLLSVSVLPVSVVLALFPDEVLRLWTGNPTVADNTAATLRLLVIGTAINGLMGMPFTLQVAHGWTRLLFYTNVIAVLVMVPLIYSLSLHYGGLGAAAAWIALNCGYVLFMSRHMHHRLLPRELREWLMTDVGAPLAAVLSIALVWRLFVPVTPSYAFALVNLAVLSLLSVAAATLAAPQMRKSLGHWLAHKLHPKTGEVG